MIVAIGLGILAITMFMNGTTNDDKLLNKFYKLGFAVVLAGILYEILL